MKPYNLELKKFFTNIGIEEHEKYVEAHFVPLLNELNQAHRVFADSLGKIDNLFLIDPLDKKTRNFVFIEYLLDDQIVISRDKFTIRISGKILTEDELCNRTIFNLFGSIEDYKSSCEIQKPTCLSGLNESFYNSFMSDNFKENFQVKGYNKNITNIVSRMIKAI